MALLALTAALFSGCASRSKLKATEAEVLSLRSEIEDLKVELGRAEGETDEARARARELESQLRDWADKEEAYLEKIDRLTVVRLPETLLFRFGSANITQEGKETLGDLAEVLNDFPDYDVRVEGHTDDKGIKEEYRDKFYSNWELSTLRATTVLRYLITRHNLVPDRMSAVGYGEYRPVAPNDTAEGRARNRRVEFHITKAKPRDMRMAPEEIPVP
jgi:chemotaxis protein MotB